MPGLGSIRETVNDLQPKVVIPMHYRGETFGCACTGIDAEKSRTAPIEGSLPAFVRSGEGKELKSIESFTMPARLIQCT